MPKKQITIPISIIIILLLIIALMLSLFFTKNKQNITTVQNKNQEQSNSTSKQASFNTQSIEPARSVKSLITNSLTNSKAFSNAISSSIESKDQNSTNNVDNFNSLKKYAIKDFGDDTYLLKSLDNFLDDQQTSLKVKINIINDPDVVNITKYFHLYLLTKDTISYLGDSVTDLFQFNYKNQKHWFAVLNTSQDRNQSVKRLYYVNNDLTVVKMVDKLLNFNYITNPNKEITVTDNTILHIDIDSRLKNNQIIADKGYDFYLARYLDNLPNYLEDVSAYIE